MRPVCAANNDKRGISILVGSRRAELLRLQQHSLRKEKFDWVRIAMPLTIWC